jgi:transposase
MTKPISPTTKEIIRLHAEGLSTSEIAATLGLKISLIRSALYRAYLRGEAEPIRKPRPWFNRYLLHAKLGVLYPRQFLSGLDEATVSRFLHDARDHRRAHDALRKIIHQHYNPTHKE